MKYYLFLISGCLFLLFGIGAFAIPACIPFQANLKVQAPAPPEIILPKVLPSRWEENLLHSIASVESQATFPTIYYDYLSRLDSKLSDSERYQWLSCLAYFVNLVDANHPGQKWTAIVDNLPSRILYPIDIDKALGLPLNPFQIKAIPINLRIGEARPSAAYYQNILFQDFGILAIDHTDHQSPLVLKELVYLLRWGLGKNATRKLPSLHYLYAFSGHDRHGEIAAYHHQVKAISVGGEKSYSMKKLGQRERIDLLAALAHEIGHAFIFDQMTPQELIQVASQFGQWSFPAPVSSKVSLYSPIFFQSMIPENVKPLNLTTQYAAINIHEWFAEAFAAQILMLLGDNGHLGRNWRIDLKKPAGPENYWTDYGNLTREFQTWLFHKIWPESCSAPFEDQCHKSQSRFLRLTTKENDRAKPFVSKQN